MQPSLASLLSAILVCTEGAGRSCTCTAISSSAQRCIKSLLSLRRGLWVLLLLMHAW